MFALSRRAFVGSAGIAGVVAGTAGPAAANSGPYDLSDPLDRLAAYAKVRAATDGSPRYYHYYADCFGIADAAVPQLMFRRQGVSVHRMTINADRTVNLRYTECNYTLDLDGKTIDIWRNPITGEDRPVKNQAPGTGPRVLLTKEGARDTAMKLTPPSGAALLFSPPTVSGGRVWFTDDIMFFRTTADAANFQMSMARPGDIQLTEMVTFEAALEDVQNPNVTSVRSTASVAAVVPWMPWMGMNAIPGRMLLRYLCRKLDRVEEIPAWLAGRIDTDHPGFLSDPKLEM